MIEILINKNGINIIENGEKKTIDKNFIDYDISEEFQKLISNFESKKISGIGIKNMYIYDDIEIYNFARGTICNKIKDMLNKFLLIEAIVKKYGNKNIKIYTNDSIYRYICEKMFNLNCEAVIEDNEEKTNKRRRFSKLFRIINGFLYLFKYKLMNSGKEKILFITHASDINSIKIKNKTIDYDCQFGNVLESLKSENKVFRIQYLNNDLVLDKSKKIGKDFLPFENFLILKKTLYKNKINNDKLINKLNMLKDFDFYVHGYNLYSLFNEFLFSNLTDIYNSYIYEIYSAEKFIKFLKIDKIICTDEADRARCFIYSGNKLKLPTFAVQHGIITEASVSYFIPSKDKIYIPTKTFVWGEEFKDKLIQGTRVYNNENTVVVGQTRTDYLYEKMNDLDTDESSNSKLKILYATQYIEELAREATDFLFSSLSHYEREYEIIIKLHPNDTFYAMYDKLAKKYNIKNIIITKDMDIYNAIIWSDVVISVHSTINLESAILNKPSICLLLSNYWDQGNFVKNNISKGAKNEEELLYLLNNTDWNVDKEYIKRNFYKIDGLVSERIKTIINMY